MKVCASIDYPAAPEQVFAMLTDEEFQSRKCAATGALAHEVAVTEAGDRTRILTRRTVPTGTFPDFLKGMVGASLVVSQTDDWGPAGPDGSRQGTITVTIGGAPIGMTGTLSLVPTGAGSVQGTDGELRATVPFIGGRIEKAAAPAIEAAISVERETGLSWLSR